MVKRILLPVVLFFTANQLNAQLDTVFIKGSVLPNVKKLYSITPEQLNQNMPVVRPSIKVYNIPNVAKTQAYKIEMIERYGDSLLSRPKYRVIPSEPR